MRIMAETLWDIRSNISQTRHRYLAAAFGEDAKLVLEYFRKIHSLIDPGCNYRHRDIMLSADISKTQELLRFVEESRPSLEQIAKKQKTVVRQKSALYLLHHNKYLALIIAATIAYSKEDKGKGGCSS